METTLSSLMTETEVSQALRVSKAALRRWRREHRGPSYLKIERVIRYDPGSVKEFLEQRCSGNNPSAGISSPMKQKAADRESAARREARGEYATPQT